MRQIHPDIIEALDSKLFRPAFFVGIGFDEPLYFSSLNSSYTVDGIEYFGAANLGSVSSVTENLDLDPQEFKITLAAIADESLDAILNSNYLNREAYCLVGLLDNSGNLIGDSTLSYFQGKTDKVKCSLGKTGLIEVTVRDRLADWNRPRIEKNINSEQQAKYPGDKGFEFVSQIQDMSLIWPQDEYFYQVADD